MSEPIAIPTRTLNVLEQISQQQRVLNAQADAIVFTVRDLLGVPDDYVLRELAAGFVAPAPVSQDVAPA